jgi:FtsZ-binding cell division protein ZapB
MATPPGHQTETDALSHLEDRIQRAVALVHSLRKENEVALKELAATQTALEDSRRTNSQLSEEVESLRDERQQVRGRLEKLIGHIDQLGAS